MVLEYPSPDQPNSTSTSTGIRHQISSSTDLAFTAVGFMAPHIGESFNRFHGSSNVIEAIWKEIEKERIREEIIAEEVARRRMLEMEVRRELMMERGDGFVSFGFSPLLKQQAEAMAMSLDVSRHDMEQIPELPFRPRGVEPKISKAEILQVQPSGYSGILMAKTDTIFSGAERKAITRTEEVADKPSLSSALVKNIKEWSCALCQVSTTNEGGLNVHFQGKKHKRKEAALREQKDDKNCSIGLFPKKLKFIQLVEPPCDDLISGKKSEEGSSGPYDDDPPSLLIDDGADDLRKDAYNTANAKQNNREFKFWCDTCKVGTFSKKVMGTHKIGKKHARHLQQLIGKDKQ